MKLLGFGEVEFVHDSGAGPADRMVPPVTADCDADAAGWCTLIRGERPVYVEFTHPGRSWTGGARSLRPSSFADELKDQTVEALMTSRRHFGNSVLPR